MGKLDGKVAIITGGSTGIGKGIAVAFAEEGCGVVIAARNLQRLEQAARDLSGLAGKVVPHVADVTDEASVQGLFDEALARQQNTNFRRTFLTFALRTMLAVVGETDDPGPAYGPSSGLRTPSLFLMATCV
jgi:NAD(P)-dependent dehydrogenase (short-subunit alcohol dehydrogenase family)